MSSWIVSSPALPVITSSALNILVPDVLKISSPEPPINVSLLVFDPSSMIKKAPLDTAEPSILVVESPVVVVIVRLSLPRFVNVALPKVSD